MSYNPYNSPQPAAGRHDPADPRSQLSGPAIAIMIVSGISLAIVSLGLVFDLFLILSGNVGAAMPAGPIDETTKITVRIIWGLILAASNCFTLFAGFKMKNLKSFQIAYTGAIVSVIPCLGPCCLLGIPFGVWAIVVMNEPQTKRAFRS